MYLFHLLLCGWFIYQSIGLITFSIKLPKYEKKISIGIPNLNITTNVSLESLPILQFPTINYTMPKIHFNDIQHIMLMIL
jgi:4-amino-4-deoxy-L-arabinose transferase-like glycosyltransferase